MDDNGPVAVVWSHCVAYEYVQPYCPGCGLAFIPKVGGREVLNRPVPVVCACGWQGTALFARSQEIQHGA